jgi:NAD-dependent DNA ligase
MTHRERGAINAVWFVFVIVLFLGAMGALYMQNQELTRAREAEKRAIAEQERADATAQNEVAQHQALSVLVGFRAEGARLSSQPSITTKINEVRDRFPGDIGQSDSTLESIIDRLRAIAERNERTANEQQNNAATELAARNAAESSRNSANASLQEQLDQANRDLADSRNTLTQQQSAADTRAADLQRLVDDATVQKNEAEAAHQKALSEVKGEADAAKSRVNSLAEKLKIHGSDENPWAVDGKIGSVGANTGLVFVDIGSQDLLRAGVKFDVFRFGKGGELIKKGAIEIRETFKDYSRAGILSEVNPLDPISEGDVVANPHFSRNRTKVFALLGNFPAYGREFLAQRLRDLGCEVQDTVTSSTDFLVLGEKSSEPDAPELTDDPSYKLAKDTGVQIFKLSDIERFLRP